MSSSPNCQSSDSVLASMRMSDGKLTESSDHDRFPHLKGCLKELQEPIQQLNGVFHRDPRLLMNARGDMNLLHASYEFHLTRQSDNLTMPH